MAQKSPTTASFLTSPGRGGIAVIHLAGPDTDRILSNIFRPVSDHRREDDRRSLRLGRLVCDDETIDEVIVCCRENRAEINIHGGPVAARRSLELLADIGASINPPDSSSAFDPSHPEWNNPAVGTEMLDLLSNVQCAIAAAFLTSQWSDGLSRLAREATLAVEKGHVGESLADNLTEVSERLQIAERLIAPPEVVIAGPPNAGKSTLANSLVGRHVSIVTDTPGTTRDWVREKALLDGIAVWLTDTAGLWQTSNGIDAEAVKRSRARIEDADLVILLFPDETRFDPPDWIPQGKFLRVASKSDAHAPEGEFDVTCSARTGEGIDELRHEILDRTGLADVNPGAAHPFTRRQADLLAQASGAIATGQYEEGASLLRSLLEG